MVYAPVQFSQVREVFRSVMLFEFFARKVRLQAQVQGGVQSHFIAQVQTCATVIGNLQGARHNVETTIRIGFFIGWSRRDVGTHG